MSWEYLISNSFLKTNNSLVRISKILSLFGMAVGCFSLVIALAVMNGFESLVKNKLIGFEGDLRISGHFNPKDILKIDGIEKIVSFMQRRGVVETKDEFSIVTFKAVNLKEFKQFYDIPLRGNSPKDGQVLIGQDLAIRLNLEIGDSILLYSPIDQNFGFGLQKKKKMLISGIFFSKVLDYDNKFVFMTIEDGLNLFKRKQDKLNADIRIALNKDIHIIKEELKSLLDSGILVQAWYDLNESLVNAMRMEKLGTIIVLSLIFVVAAFNLAMTLSLNSIQNLKEIGLLKTIGASKIVIRKIIIIMGFKLAGIGALYGITIAIGVVSLQNKFGFIPIPSEIYFLDSLPMYIDIFNILLIILLSIIFIFVASFLSGEKISKISITKALQWTK